MKIKEVVETLERFAPLPLQESYDNAGLQIGLTEADASGVLLCLDVTEEVVAEAIEKNCNVIVAHHPLLFRGLKRIADSNMIERCVRQAILHGVTIYAAHTNLDNVLGGVNFEIAKRLGLTQVSFLEPLPQGGGGSGVIGLLPQAESSIDFLKRVKQIFQVDCLQHNAPLERMVRKVALCGGSGDFLLEKAIKEGADVFLTGEMGYHHFFGYDQQIQIGVLGHYQSEQYTINLLADVLRQADETLRLERTTVNTNPIHYL
ncbi:MAG: Nif3-like dinuclear metal center hexameric protein [Bacteroidaceae bacterium]|nr:Nif3-like dinuclear metal center hexameric protein [Bacteroidaceae bacterium]